jgi:hypothetical protein
MSGFTNDTTMMEIIVKECWVETEDVINLKYLKKVGATKLNQ